MSATIGGLNFLRIAVLDLKSKEAAMALVGGRSLALIVEDDQFQRDVLSEILKNEDLDVIQCETAEAAELVIANFGAELKVVVTDVNLGDQGNGVDLAGFARQQFPHLNVIVVSGKAQPGLPTGVRFLIKPYQVSELLKAANLGDG